MDRKKSIFFICVTLIVLALIYYIFKKFKGRTLPTPSPPAQTDELSISDLKFVRTLNPDKSNSESEISGYTIEYDTGINYIELSQNVTFTITWKNNIGFNNVVEGFKIKHYVKPDSSSAFSIDEANAIFTFTDTVVNNDNSVNTGDFGENTVKIVSTGYSVIGENAFKIEVIKNDETTVEVYDGVNQTSDRSNHHIPVSEEELGATLAMTSAQSVTYTPVVSSDKMASVDKNITKVKYNITNGSVNLHDNQAIFLLPATPGSVTAGVRVDAETFFFQYTDGDYLLHDLSKGAWNNQSSKTNTCDDACHTRGDFDNRIYIAFYNSTITDGIEKRQLRKTNMGYGLGTDFISSDANTLTLSDMASQTGTVSQTEYNNSFWTFTASSSSTAVSSPATTGGTGPPTVGSAGDTHYEYDFIINAYSSKIEIEWIRIDDVLLTEQSTNLTMENAGSSKFTVPWITFYVEPYSGVSYNPGTEQYKKDMLTMDTCVDRFCGMKSNGQALGYGTGDPLYARWTNLEWDSATRTYDTAVGKKIFKITKKNSGIKKFEISYTSKKKAPGWKITRHVWGAGVLKHTAPKELVFLETSTKSSSPYVIPNANFPSGKFGTYGVYPTTQQYTYNIPDDPITT
jgi:hypothetical protein